MVEIWNSLSTGVQGFIISTAAGLSTNFISSFGGKKTGEIEEPLKVAFQAGLARFFSKSSDSSVDTYLQGLLNTDEVMELLVEVVKDPSLANKRHFRKDVEQAIKNAGVDIESLDGFDLKKALNLYTKGFQAKAESDAKLHTWWSRYVSEESLNTQKEGVNELKRIRSKVEGKKPNYPLLKKKYFNFLKEKYSHMSFKGLSEGKLISFPVEKIYTNLTFDNDIPHDPADYLKKKEEIDQLEFFRAAKEREPITLSHVLDSQYSIVTGDPGAGKSTLLKYIALAYVDNKVKERLGKDGGLLPLLFPVAAYAEGRKKEGIGYSLKEFIPAYFNGKNQHGLWPLFERALEKGKALVLVDGLDEVADEAERKQMVEAIRNFMIDDKYSKNRFVITCRTAGYTKSARFENVNGKEFSHFSVLPFDIDHIKDFLYNWYCCYEKDINERHKSYEAEAKKDRNKMVAVIENDKNIFLISTNPLMLTILALIEHEGGELPKNRADLYAKCLKMLAGSWENLRSLHETEQREFKLGNREITEDFIVDFLGPIAYEMHENSSPEIEYEDLKYKLSKKLDRRNKDMLLSKQQADEFIQIMKERSGILQEALPGIYMFMHLTFKEYLSARVLTDLSDDRIGKLGDKLFTPEWKEVALLTAASLRKRDATEFIKEIFKKETGRYENLSLAGECIINTGRDKIDDELFDDIIIEMQNAVEGDVPGDDKVAVAEALGWIGDPRELNGFIEIDGGEYDLEDLGGKMIEPFEMGRYPVTNRWFEEFIADGGYSRHDYWSDEGWKWLKHSKADQPGLWDERKWSCPNSPVVGVCWYEADAFTKWLTHKRDDGYEYRLPTEEEWQAAAAGFKRREYPWGEWKKGLCNIGDTNIGRTSPVGIYKKGSTPIEIFDLSGNVWEWTKSDYEKRMELGDFIFSTNYKKMTQKPVLRGGSWDNNQRGARCAFRNMGDPAFRYNVVGFRCVRTLR